MPTAYAMTAANVAEIAMIPNPRRRAASDSCQTARCRDSIRANYNRRGGIRMDTATMVKINLEQGLLDLDGFDVVDQHIDFLVYLRLRQPGTARACAF
jgi:hypothetical protein